MKKLLFDTGGRPFDIDDFETLQGQTYAALAATFANAPAMVLSGCEVSITGPNIGDIAPGYIWLQGEVHHYDGAAAVALPAEVVAGSLVDIAVQAYEDGNSKTTIAELELITQAAGTAAAGVEKITFVKGPVQRYAKWLESLTRSRTEVQWLTSHDASLYDPTGKGWPDLAGAGWALCNGQNGTGDLQERFIVAKGAGNDYDAPRKTGGAAQVTLDTTQLPAHSHTMQAAGQHAHNAQVLHEGNDASRIYGTFVGQQNGAPGGSATAQVQAAGSHAHTIDETGGGQPVENRPPFYVLVAREWVGL
jgi:microcystin-dependent protein